jgi:ATP-dependent protease ClpP protease subunit
MNENVAYIIFSAEINGETKQRLINAVNDLMSNGRDEIRLMISTGGGGVVPGFEIYNTLRALPVKLVAYNMASVNSIGNVVFLAADERYACASSTFMFHGVSWDVPANAIAGPQAKEILGFIEADERRISETIADRTELTVEQAEKFFEEAATLGARQALEMGIVSAVEEPKVVAGCPLVVIA